jgi:uncharacterized membrane protein YkvA (DUF1232 family)
MDKISWIRKRFDEIPKFMMLLWSMLQDDEVPSSVRDYCFAAVDYVIIVEDMIPDDVKVLGKIDDICVITLALFRILEDVPISFVQKYEGKFILKPGRLQKIALEAPYVFGRFYDLLAEDIKHKVRETYRGKAADPDSVKDLRVRLEAYLTEVPSEKEWENFDPARLQNFLTKYQK